MLTSNAELWRRELLLEGKEISLNWVEGNKWENEFKNEQIEGDLDVNLFCKGINGTGIDLTVSIGSQPVEKFSDKISCHRFNFFFKNLILFFHFNLGKLLFFFKILFNLSYLGKYSASFPCRPFVLLVFFGVGFNSGKSFFAVL